MIIHFIVSSLPFSTHHYVALVCLHSHYTYLCLKEGCNWDLVGFYFQVPAGPIFRLYFFSESEYFIFLNFTIFQGQQDLCPLVVVASGYPVSLRKDLLDCINGFWLRKKALSSFPTLHDHSFHRVFVAFPNLHTLCCTCFLFTHTWCLGTFLCLLFDFFGLCKPVYLVIACPLWNLHNTGILKLISKSYCVRSSGQPRLTGNSPSFGPSWMVYDLNVYIVAPLRFAPLMNTTNRFSIKP